MDVINETEQRILPCRGGHQTEHCEPDEKAIGPRARAQAERCRDRVLLRLRQSFAPVWQNPIPQEAFAFMLEEEAVETLTVEDLAG